MMRVIRQKIKIRAKKLPLRISSVLLDILLIHLHDFYRCGGTDAVCTSLDHHHGCLIVADAAAGFDLEGIADGSAKYASAAVNGSLNLVFNGIWSRQTDYFTVPGGSLTITGYGTAEGTQRYKISVWQKVAGGAQYVNDSTYYFKTDGQNYRCVISGLDPAASYRLTISYDSSRYYLYGGLKVEGIAG